MYTYLKKYCLLFIACSVLHACDTTVDDGLVSVRYKVTSETGATYSVGAMIDNGDWVGGYMDEEWEYEFRVAEGSQLLYMTTENVMRGYVDASIYIDGELYRTYRHEESSSTAEIQKGTSAWGLDQDIRLFYFLQAATLEGAQLRLLPGVQTFNQPDSDFGFGQRIYRELLVGPEFDASIRISRPSMEEGYTCVWAEISYQPVEGADLVSNQNFFSLGQVYQCDVAPVEVDLAVIVPGY